MPRFRIRSLVLLLVFTSCALRAQSAELAIAHAHVIHMDGEGVLEDGTVLVGGGRILEVGPSSEVHIPPGCTVVDAGNGFLIPGLVDAHTHTLVPTDFQLHLAHGVTTVLEMSGNPQLLQFREELRSGTRRGPRLFVTSPLMKPGADPLVDREVRTESADEMPELVRRLAARGYDFLKVWGPQSADVHRALCAAAEKVGIRVTGHVPRAVGLRQTFANGQSSIAHVEEYWNKFFLRRRDAELLDEAVEITRAAGAPVVTTLITYENIAYVLSEDDAVQQARPELRWIDTARRIFWTTELNDYRQRPNAPEGRSKLAELEFKKRIANALHEGGVPLVAGTDSGALNLTLFPGGSLHRELELLVEAGLEPWDALATATVNAGQFLGGEPFGAIAPGHRADLVLLDKNPLDDIRNTMEIVGVAANGTWFDRAGLDGLLDSVEQTIHASNALAQDVLDQGTQSAFQRYDARPAGSVPYEPMALGLVGYLLTQNNRMDEAVAVFQRIMQDHPDLYVTYFVLGAAAAASGDKDTARQLLETTLRLVPDHIQAQSILRSLGG